MRLQQEELRVQALEAQGYVVNDAGRVVGRRDDSDDDGGGGDGKNVGCVIC